MDVIKEDVFRKQLKKGLSGGYLFFGEEDYLKSFSLRSARQAVCPDETFAVFNDISIDPLDYSASDLVKALMSPPMMSDKKIVTINGLAISDMKSSELDELYDALSVLPEYDYNVLIISVPCGLIDEGNLFKKPSSVILELSKHLSLVQFNSISGARLAGWIGKHFEHHGVRASADVCNMLMERCGRSMFTLASETEKISFFVLSDGRDTVTPQDVESVSASVIESDAYALTNAILDGKHSEAIDALNVMRFRRIDPVIILSEVSSTVSNLISTKALLSEGFSAAEISRILKINEYKTKLYAQAAPSKSMQNLKRALLLCSEADLSLKLNAQGYIPIERLICCF